MFKSEGEKQKTQIAHAKRKESKEKKPRQDSLESARETKEEKCPAV